MISHIQLYHTQNRIRKTYTKIQSVEYISSMRFLLSLLSRFPFIFCVVSVASWCNEIGTHLIEYECGRLFHFPAEVCCRAVCDCDAINSPFSVSASPTRSVSDELLIESKLEFSSFLIIKLCKSAHSSDSFY